MPKNVKKDKKDTIKTQKRLGRPPELKRPENLPERFRQTKAFLENYWGSVGLGLKSARHPDEVRTALLLVAGIEWKIPFHDQGHARCLIQKQATKVDANVMRETRRKLQAATKRLDDLWTNFHNLSQSARQASDTVTSTIAQFGLVMARLIFSLSLPPLPEFCRFTNFMSDFVK